MSIREIFEQAKQELYIEERKREYERRRRHQEEEQRKECIEFAKWFFQTHFKEDVKALICGEHKTYAKRLTKGFCFILSSSDNEPSTGLYFCPNDDHVTVYYDIIKSSDIGNAIKEEDLTN